MKKLLTIGFAFGVSALLGASLLYSGSVTAGVCFSSFTGAAVTTAFGTTCPASLCDPSLCLGTCGGAGTVSSCSVNGGMCLLVCTY
ncbi:MAG: hypothetical protein ACJ763_00700 [Bdellovibrionia bacterium]